MSDLLQDSITGDFVFTDGALTIVDGAEQVAQDIARRLKTFQGSWFLDLTIGVPYFSEILAKDPERAAAALQAEILGADGIIRLESFDLQVGIDRQAIATFTAQSKLGPIQAKVTIP